MSEQRPPSLPGGTIRLTHVIPMIGVGGSEGVVLDLCRHRGPEYRTCVASTWTNPSAMEREFQACGAAVVCGDEAVKRAIRWADVVNVHALSDDPAYLNMAAGKPHVVSLHLRLALPRLSAPAISTSHHALAIQPHPERFVAIPNGVDLERFRPHSKPEREEVVLTRVCRPPRCAPYFWDAMHQVLARYPQVRLQIVGNPEPCRHPSPRVRFLGVRRDIPGILADTDLFVYTPYPGFGTKDLVVMEASAAGVPCVVSDVHVTRESVEQGVNGFRTPYGDVDAFAAQVGRMVKDAALRRRMGEAAAEKARREFDVRNVARKYEAVYRAVLAHAASSGGQG